MIGAPLHDAVAGLDRIAAGPEPTKIVFDNDIRFRKSLVDRTEGKEPVVNQVGALVLPNDRAVRIERLLGIYDRRENLIVDFDQFQSVLGDVTARRRNRGDGIADEPDFIVCEAIPRPTDRKAVHGLRPILGVFTGNHRGHAGKFLGLGCVDAFDARVGMRAAQDRREQHSRKRNIIAEFCSAGEQGRILNARRVFAQVARLGQWKLTQISPFSLGHGILK